ncbi:MAG: DUF624 domain-containing protein [Eisenbergiella sp.]
MGLMILNFAVLLCLPVITGGVGDALYYITLKMAEDEVAYIQEFLKAFRDNLVHPVIHLIVTAAGAVLLLDFWYFVRGQSAGTSA